MPRLPSALACATVAALIVIACGASPPTTPAPLAPNASLASLTVDATVRGGATASASVTLTGTATAPVTINLSSNAGAAVVPSSVVVPAGASAAAFSIATTPVTSAIEVAISATGGGETRAAVLRVLPAVAPVLQTLEIVSPVPSGQPASATVTLDTAGTSDVIVTLSSNDSYAIPPASVLIPSGSRSAAFSIETRASGVSFDTTITAAAGGQSRSSTLRLEATLPPPPTGPAPPAPSGRIGTFFTYVSQAGDFIGGGYSRTYTPADGTFRSSWQCSNSQVYIQMLFGGNAWHATFQSPQGTVLQPGVTYSGARRFPFQPRHLPGLSVSGESRGCNTLYGTFTVHEVDFGAGGQVNRFRATFEQRCERETAPILQGEISVVSPPLGTQGDYCGGMVKAK